jgi:hypothetical protein
VVEEVNLARTCILVERGRYFLGRSQSHPVHVSAVDDVDLDGSTMSLAVTKPDVFDAREFRELDEEARPQSRAIRHSPIPAVRVCV